MERDLLELARRGPKGNVDRFLAFWIDIITQGRQSHIEAVGGRVRKSVTKFVRDVAPSAVAVGEDTVVAELQDAARIYFATCLTDSQYTSTLFGTKRLETDQVRRKAAADAAAALGALADAGTFDGLGQRLPGALARGFVDAMPESEQSLRDAVAGHRSARGIEPLIWDR